MGNGKFKQASGSYQDYFAAKMAALKAQGRFKEVPEWKEENTLGGQTLGHGAGNGRAVDREIQRESLLCPDYLKAARDQSATDKEEQEVEAEAGQVAKKRKRQTEKSVETDIVEISEDQEAVKKSKKKKKDTKESSPASERVDADVDAIEASEPPVKKKKKNK